MGNKQNTGNEAVLASYTPRDDIYTSTPQGNRHTSSTTPSPQFQKRSLTVTERHKIPDVYVPVAPTLSRSGSDATSYGSSHRPLFAIQNQNIPSSDSLGNHVLDSTPKDGDKDVPLGTSIVILFDKDVRTINTNKLIELSCDSMDPVLNPIKGRANHDPRQQRVEFVPENTLIPNTKYSILLNGKAITTASCTHSANIKSKEIHFTTTNPPPKTVGIKLRGQPNCEKLQIASYYDLFNSLILWSTRKWGCSGEHVTGVFSEKDGKLIPIQNDLDVLNVKENEVIIIQIKD